MSHLNPDSKILRKEMDETFTRRESIGSMLNTMLFTSFARIYEIQKPNNFVH